MASIVRFFLVAFGLATFHRYENGSAAGFVGYYKWRKATVAFEDANGKVLYRW